MEIQDERCIWRGRRAREDSKWDGDVTGSGFVYVVRVVGGTLMVRVRPVRHVGGGCRGW